MLALIGFAFLVLLCIGFRVSKSFLAPHTIMCLMWIGVIVIYYLISPDLYEIQARFPLAVLLWVSGFYLSSVFTYSITALGKEKKQYNCIVFKIESFLAIVATVYIAYQNISSALNSDYFFTYLRALNTGLDESLQPNDTGIFAYLRSAMIIVYLIELANYNKKRKNVVLLFFFLNILVAFVCMAKTILFMILVSSIVILKIKGKISNRQIIIALMIFLLLSVIMQLVRSMESDGFSLVSFFTTYILSGSIAFDHFDQHQFVASGSYVFRFIEAVMYKLGINSTPPVETILPYTLIGSMSITNVYTMFFPFYMDFGYLGIFLFSLIYGAISGFLFKKCKSNDVALVLYSIMISCISFGFIGELLFTNFSTYLQYILFTIIPYYLLKNDRHINGNLQRS